MSQGEDPLERLLTPQDTRAGSRQEFAQQLEGLEQRLIALAEQIAEGVEPLTTAFLDADEDAALAWRDTDEGIARGCEELEEACYLLLARQSPVATDLRRVVATLRCTAEMRRSSNLLRHVAGSLTWVHPPSLSGSVREVVGQLGATAAHIYRGAVRAWREQDSLAAVELQEADDQADLLQKVLLTEIYTGDQSVEEAVSLALIARYYERVADHGVELARAVSYVVTGERLSGTPPAQDAPPDPGTETD